MKLSSEKHYIFFIYDKSQLRSHDGSPEDGILFFFPNSVSTTVWPTVMASSGLPWFVSNLILVK